jgi:hypothetical protein
MDKDGRLNGRLVVPADFGSGDEAPTLAADYTVAPLANVTVEPAAVALTNVLAQAGCSLRRDSVDARLIDAVRSYGARGKIIRSEAEASGIGEIKEMHAVALRP